MATIKVIKGFVTQTGNDVLTIGTIDTGLGITDQRTLWNLVGMDLEWVNGLSLTAKPAWSAKGILTRDSAKVSFQDDEFLCQIDWAAHAGLAPAAVQALRFEHIKRHVFIEENLVANSKLYVVAASSLTALANQLRYRVFVEERKVTELEFLKAQTGYCVC